MSIKRFVANADTTITDAFIPSLTRRSYYANMGAADSLEVFSLFGQASTNSVEKSRILLKFPVEEIVAERASGSLPNSGSVNFYLKLSNVEHPLTLPSDYDLLIAPISSSWEEGTGLDMEDYTDQGITGSIGRGTNWFYRELNTTWITYGGDYLYDYKKIFHIDKGDEDLFVDITDIVENQINNTIPNHGIGVMLSGSYENSTGSISFYTKRFSARNSQYFYKRPFIEARWESSIKDDRADFYCSSSLLESEDNKYNLYFYNRIKGTYKNIPNNPSLTVKFYTNDSKTVEVIPTYISMSNPSVGVYKAVVSIDTTASALYDFWVNSSNTSSQFFSSSFDIKQFTASENNEDEQYIFKITNLKDQYNNKEKAKLRIFSRNKNWNPTIYTVSNTTIENSIHKNLYYKIFRYRDNYNIIDYSTGSLKYSLTSYDLKGNYFELDMSLLEIDYLYGIKLALLENNLLKESSEIFKFRVE